MNGPQPHYLLFCDGSKASVGSEKSGAQRSRWRFVLEHVESGEKTEASDCEPGCAADRSALIAVLRGLEALEQPSRVTLVTTSRYVSRGLKYGLIEWRDNDFSWEHFGAVQPIRNADMWKRIDRALGFHQVQCRYMAQEESAEASEEFDAQTASEFASSQTEIAAVATSVQTTTTTSTRRRAQPTSARASLPTSSSKPQRVYVDTPVSTSRASVSVTSTAARSSTEAADSAPQILETLAPCNFAKPQECDPAHRRTCHKSSQCSSWRCIRSLAGNLFATLTRPFRMSWCGGRWLYHRIWVAILAIDDWLESYLRCLFWLDPKSRPSRR